MDSNYNNTNNAIEETEPVLSGEATTEVPKESPATEAPLYETPVSVTVAPVAEAPRKKKKEHKFLKKFFGCIGLAACFGIVAGGAFFGVRYAIARFFPQAAYAWLCIIHYTFSSTAATLHAGSTTYALPSSTRTSRGLMTTLSVSVNVL